MAKLTIPHFWHGGDASKGGALSWLLWPLSLGYRFLCVLDQSVTVRGRASVPVVCVGNVTMGGAGKTPTARMLLKLVEEHGKFNTACFLMRGYGGNYSGAVEVDLAAHTTWDVGDEALMQARYAPTIVARNRRRGAQLAAERGYDLIIMDDGFQNFSLRKNFSLLVVDGQFGFGNRLCFPAGPLREPLQKAAERAHAVMVINRTPGLNMKAFKKLRNFDAVLELNHDGDADHKPEPGEVIAFAGIARPEKFFDTLAKGGYSLHSQFAFPDHHIYRHNELNNMHQRAERAGIRLVTTEKDWIRLSRSWRQKIDYIKVSVKPDNTFRDHFFKILDRL